MAILILGLVIFLGTHAFTMARGPRAALVARLGENGYKGVYSLVSISGFILAIWGYGLYRAGGYIPVWDPPTGLRHLALLLNLPIFILLAVPKEGSAIRGIVKHPMLLAVKIWAFSHLLANGDLGSIILFGSFLAWAVAARISLKSRPGAVDPPRVSFNMRDWLAIGAGLVLYVVFVVWLHPLLIGVPVLPGS